MQTYEILVSGRAVLPNGDDTTLVRSSIGVDELHVLFDSDEWMGFPVTVTFSNGDTSVSQSIQLTSVEGFDGVACESSCVIPWEVIQDVGGIALTFQGTDSDGNHIITEASGTPLTVVEAGAVAEGSVPEAAPTVTDWQQAYADANEAVQRAASLVENLESQLAQMVEDAKAEVVGEANLPIATTEALGVIIVGDGLQVEEDGTLSTEETNGLTSDQLAALQNLRRLAAFGFASVFDEQGVLQSVTVNPNALPIATSTARGAVQPDGSSIEVGAGGTLSIAPGYFEEQFGSVDGVIRYKGAVQDSSSLPSGATTGDMYIVGDSVLFWDGSQWSEISSAVDLSGYVAQSDVHAITPAEIHEITQRTGDYSRMAAYVTQASLEASLSDHESDLEAAFDAKVAEMETYLDEQLEAILNGSY